jgi:hypothetical protein
MGCKTQIPIHLLRPDTPESKNLRILRGGQHEAEKVKVPFEQELMLYAVKCTLTLVYVWLLPCNSTISAYFWFIFSVDVLIKVFYTHSDC